MTTNPKIKFVCPTCREDRIVELRSQVDLKTEVAGVFVTRDPATNGTKCSLEQGNEGGRTDGKVTGFCCDACGFIIKTQRRLLGTWQRKHYNKPEFSTPKPITTPRGLYLWLKRNNMIEEPENAIATTA